MLIKAETVLNKEKLANMSQDEVIKQAQSELVREIIKDLFEKRLIKTEVAQEFDPIYGECVKMRVSLQAYNPDD